MGNNSNNNEGKENSGNILAMLQTNKSLVALVAFCVLAFAAILIGVFALKAPAVAMCALAIIEAGIAVMLHRAELWLHGVMVLAQIIAGIIVGRIGVIILCVIVYILATVALGISDKEQDAKPAEKAA